MQTIPRAFANAFSGLYHFFCRERNGRIQLVITIIIIIASIMLNIYMMEWLIVLLCIIIVLSLEMLNSAIEKLCDITDSNYNPAIKLIKDVAAAAVLWASLISAVIGAVIFLPRIIYLFKILSIQ